MYIFKINTKFKDLLIIYMCVSIMFCTFSHAFSVYNLFVFVILAMTIKRKLQTKYKLPTLNWIALKPNQVKGTVFSELDDDKLYSVSLLINCN